MIECFEKKSKTKQKAGEVVKKFDIAMICNRHFCIGLHAYFYGFKNYNHTMCSIRKKLIDLPYNDENISRLWNERDVIILLTCIVVLASIPS
jgi:hypothetical protein